MNLLMCFIALKLLQNGENHDTSQSEKYFGFFCSRMDRSQGFIHFEYCTSIPTFIFIVEDAFQNYAYL